MIRKNYNDVESVPATLSNGTKVEDVTFRWLIDKNVGAQNFAMRRFEIKVEGKVPLHNHPQEHEIYVLSGNAKFYNGKSHEEIVKEGDTVFIPPNESHGIDNLGKEKFVFICLIPYLEK
ncbi:MAG: cupin domain-containing protein [Promethearchaeota archaeon]|jgi:quercetin dioxygenase-like cupin family protein